MRLGPHPPSLAPASSRGYPASRSLFSPATTVPHRQSKVRSLRAGATGCAMPWSPGEDQWRTLRAMSCSPQRRPGGRDMPCRGGVHYAQENGHHAWGWHGLWGCHIVAREARLDNMAWARRLRASGGGAGASGARSRAFCCLRESAYMAASWIPREMGEARCGL